MNPHRVNIINILQLISSTKDQMEYQEKAHVNVAAELVNQWFDDFYHPADVRFKSAFSPQELALLAKFNEFYDLRVPSLPETLTEMRSSDEWAEVVAFANEVLRTCEWIEVKATYDR